MNLEKFKNKKIAILGFGLEWKSSLRFLLKLWIELENITILDWNKNLEITEKVEKILWEKYLENLEKFDLIFKSPWISPYDKKILPFRKKLISNSEIFFENYNWKIIWVTATKGKSTVVTLIYKTLQEAEYNVKLVGNIWKPIFDEIDILWNEKYDFIIYELSSYMLETMQPKLFIWILWNIFPCHIDWHNNSMEVYKKAKTNLLKNSENIIINENFSYLIEKNIQEKNNWKKSNILNKKKYTFWKTWKYNFDENCFYIWNKKIINSENIALSWEHNKFNISSVIWVLDIIKKEKNFLALEKILKNFSWLPHRQEKIGTYKWIIFIDDAISTTPESTIEAIKTFWKNIWTIFLGWSDYWFTDESFENLKNYIEEYEIPNIVLFIKTWVRVFPEDSENMKIWEEKILYLKNNYSPKILKSDSMEEAIKFAYENTKTWKICILSSASPSFSLWKNYIEKWNEFKKFAKKYHF